MPLRAAGLLSALLAGLALASCGGEEAASPPTVTAPEQTTQETTTQDTTEETTTEDTTTQETTTEEPDRQQVVVVRVRGGVPEEGIVRASVRQGDLVVLRVRSDVADEVHVHGYDLFRDVAPGREARLSFRATIPGRFEIELEGRHVQIAELTVRP